MVHRRGLFKTTLLICGPLIILSAFAIWMSPLGLGFKDGVSDRLKSHSILTAYQFVFYSAPVSVLVALPLSSGMAMNDRTRQLGFQILIATTIILIPAQWLFIFWLSS
ncbi:MAG: hypothetical protein CMK07_00185 [Ponticaulis sp.]|nr:hypothetical protein [Ponticaulis sp.]|tara:strand:+ start:214 stop:537 length:324 start_codon:yes stop_codon:yes gene_type:complete